ncbi:MULTISPECIES: endolytic transglycosylase MltG [Cyanophyceae]|uniref:Endolytic murein transglycosylase n=1 Tax=Leptolyngbya subtilissima DQ-A4 TaxID=2933933 RepID=A0ABV0K742_9CYAN|nr:endolytic transglycosylase MltG [Nodosilinea sp. FACHB-141]MBD2112693.1 endolytic transglycosylase MltG [Nodosilinea sp. FACHB-141]
MAKGSRWVRLSFLGLLVPLAAGVAAWQGWAWWSWANQPVSETPAETAPQTVQIQIPPGTPGQQIGQDLEAAGLIRSALAWKLWSRWQTWQNAEGGFQAGTYALNPADSMTAIADVIRSGQVVQTSFTVPEGWNRRQMATYFQEEGFFSADAFLSATERVSKDAYPWLPDGIPHVEGFLFPDTYQLPAEGVTPEAVVNAMLSRFETVALPVYQQATTDLTLLQWATLASIVEKEAVIADERGTIAGVFTNRLKQNMPLGADPTVEYGLGIVQTPEQPLTWTQVGTPSPYNTYINPGLPPTPIASAGKASLEAALAPEATDYLFFVARYDGTHVFSRTLAEHEAARDAIRATIDN